MAKTKIKITLSKEETKKVLKQIDNSEIISDVPNSIGFESNFIMEIIYNDNTKTTVVFLNNGNLAINKKDNENSYVEYKIFNTNLEKELIEKYFN